MKSVILSREEMYFYDKHTIEKIGIPGKVLMENAGMGCTDFIAQNCLNPKDKTAIFCGNGNNGGDGFVISRLLKIMNFDVTVFLLGKIEKMSPETKDNYDLCVENSIEIIDLTDSENPKETLKLYEFDLIIDAIFGIGFKGEVRGFISGVIQSMNSSNAKVVSIDIASGLDADTGVAQNSIAADFTLTMAAYKYGHFLGDGLKFSGLTKIIDIGIPENLFDKFPPKLKLITKENANYPIRKPYFHKGDYGRVGIIAGSPGFSGAAIMASKGALRAGAGLITLFHPPNLSTIFETALTEVMTFAMPEKDEDNYDIEAMIRTLNKQDVLLIGPGIGTNEKIKKLAIEILKVWSKPAVLDADMLNIIANDSELLKLISGKPFVLTPHIGEFARLTGKSIAEISENPISILRKFCSQNNLNILLKSSVSIFCNGFSETINITGNDGLATGGSGDVLAGILVSFLGQKLPMKDSAVSAAYLLGKTAERIAKKRKSASIIPTDIIEELFRA
jgi:ADP-dependent NAD(P)H-hydrate dehydratase / NAD(P)H-hydrate epimerase